MCTLAFTVQSVFIITGLCTGVDVCMVCVWISTSIQQTSACGNSSLLCFHVPSGLTVVSHQSAVEAAPQIQTGTPKEILYLSPEKKNQAMTRWLFFKQNGYFDDTSFWTDWSNLLRLHTLTHTWQNVNVRLVQGSATSGSSTSSLVNEKYRTFSLKK